MSIVVWIFIGLVTGIIGSRLVGDRGDAGLRYLLLGIAGALVGGVLFNLFGAGSFTEWSPWGAIFAVIGATGSLLIHDLVWRRRI